MGFDTMARVQQDGPQGPYEVYCYRCHVTAPVGARSCLHCGGRLSGKGQVKPHFQSQGAPAGPPVFEDEEPDAEARRSGVLSPMTILWVLLGLGVTLGRLCN